MTEAVLELYKKDYKDLVKKARYRGTPPQDAEDVVQEAFTRALTYFHAFDGTKQNIGAWFNTILNNAVRDYKKEERNKGAVFDKDQHDKEALVSPDIVRSMETTITREIKNYDKPHSDILYLFYIMQYKPREICQILEVTNEVVRITTFRFKKRIMELFDESRGSRLRSKRPTARG